MAMATVYENPFGQNQGDDNDSSFQEVKVDDGNDYAGSPGAWGGASAPAWDGQAAAGQGGAEQRPKEGENKGGIFSRFSKSDPPQPTALPPTYQADPYGNAAGFGTHTSGAGSSGAGSREERLAAREVELQRWEADLKQREANLASKLNPLGDQIHGKSNFPPCCPIVHHDINNDIPPSMRGLTRRGFVCFIGVVVCLTINLAAASISLGYDVDKKVGGFFLALIYFVAGVPGAWLLWYSRLYQAARHDGALSFAMFFCMFSVHIAFCIWSAIAPPLFAPDFSHAGLFSTIKAFDKSNFLGFVYLIGAGFWGAEAAFSVLHIGLVYLAFRGQGGREQLETEVRGAAYRTAVSAAAAEASRGNSHV